MICYSRFFSQISRAQCYVGAQRMQVHVSWLTHYRAASLSASDPTFSGKCPMTGQTADQRLVRIQFRQSSGFSPDSAPGSLHKRHTGFLLKSYMIFTSIYYKLYFFSTKSQDTFKNFPKQNFLCSPKEASMQLPPPKA